MNRILIWLMLLPFCSQAQEFYPELETDRPDQTETASVVPLKSLQAESGFILESNHSANLKLKSYTYTTTLLRYGMLKKVELRLGLDYLGNKTDLDDRVSRTCGFSPLYTGFKIKLNYEHNWRPDMAFIGGIFFPFTATNVYKPRSKGGEAKFSFSHSLSRNLSLGYNLGAEWDGETTDPYYSYSLALGINLSEKWGSYIESYGKIHPDDLDEHLADGGFTWLIKPNLQADVSAGIGLKNGFDYFIGFGLSFRIPR